ncbi:septal ring lytic transglycosylase RlpA family protein [Desulfolithobacter sp.]
MKTALSLLILIVALHLAGCGRKPTLPPPGSSVPAARQEPTQRPYIINGKRYYPLPSAEGYREVGIASWYGRKFHGRNTANGERYNMYEHTAAHKTLPMNTVVLVKNLENGKQTVVRINDRGPFIHGRIIDLSYRAAKEIGLLRNGTAKVEVIAMGEMSPATVHGRSAPPARANLRKFDSGTFYIQIGSFEQKNRAREIARLFAGQGWRVVIQEFPAAGTRLYRVLLYSGTSLARARKEEKLLEQNGYPDAFVIAR